MFHRIQKQGCECTIDHNIVKAYHFCPFSSTGVAGIAVGAAMRDEIE